MNAVACWDHLSVVARCVKETAARKAEDLVLKLVLLETEKAHVATSFYGQGVLILHHVLHLVVLESGKQSELLTAGRAILRF